MASFQDGVHVCDCGIQLTTGGTAIMIVTDTVQECHIDPLLNRNLAKRDKDELMY